MPLDPDEVWSAVVGDVPPLPYELKRSCADRWIRFYALPDGQRYPSGESEFEEIVRRGNALLAKACGVDDQVMVVSGRYGRPGSIPRLDNAQRRAHPHARHWREVDAGDDEWVPHLFTTETRIARGSLDDFVRAVATQAVVLAMVIAPRGKVVVHPYDGGFDVILPSREARDEWRGRHQQWASTRADGL